MRKVILSLLLAGVAASPALGAAQDSEPDRPTRAERQAQRSERQQARDDSRPARSSEARPAREPRSSSFTPPSAPAYNPRSGGGYVRQSAPQQPAAPSEGRAQQRQQVRDARENRQDRQQQVITDRSERRDAVRQQTRVPPVFRDRVPVVSSTPQPNTQPPAPTTTRYTPRPSWSTNWRNNGRYDWYNYRNRHGSLFRLGLYFDPFGWGYQRYNIGWRLWPSYYGSNFWIDDPWSYRLPYAPPGTRWVRYYDDAILVDMWSGEVVDVIYDFFW
ncbi:MAG: RcnB family protein [Pseudomonadota bacterium]